MPLMCPMSQVGCWWWRASLVRWSSMTSGATDICRPCTSTQGRWGVSDSVPQPPISCQVRSRHHVLVTSQKMQNYFHDENQCSWSFTSLLSDLQHILFVSGEFPLKFCLSSLNFQVVSEYWNLKLNLVGYDGKLILTDLQGDITAERPSLTVARHRDKVVNVRSVSHHVSNVTRWKWSLCCCLFDLAWLMTLQMAPRGLLSADLQRRQNRRPLDHSGLRMGSANNITYNIRRQLMANVSLHSGRNPWIKVECGHKVPLQLFIF